MFFLKFYKKYLFGMMLFVCQNSFADIANLPVPIAERIATANLDPNAVSIVIRPIGEPSLVSFNANTPRMPASTQKVIPTFIALETLGKDFIWQTKLYQQGFVWKDTLYGNIIIKASGDPKLGAERLADLLKMVKNLGINHVDGDVVIDNRLFHNVQFDNQAFDNKGLRPYNASPNGLLLNFGTINIQLKKQQNADKQTVFAVQSSPNLSQFSPQNFVNTDKKPCPSNQKDLPIDLSVDTLTFHENLSDKCQDGEYWLSYPNADEYIYRFVSAEWQKIMPDFTGKIIFPEHITPPKKWQFWRYKFAPKLLGYINSAPLDEQIRDINHYSNNVMTEQVALSLPIYADKQAVSDYPKTFDFIKNWWQKNLKTSTPPTISRASGLCRDCLILPNSMADFLGFAFVHKDFDTFKQSLSLAGETGTMKDLRYRQKSNSAIGKAWIKTGTLENVTSMAGYVQGDSGRWYVVVGMINSPKVMYDPKAKAILDEMLDWTAKQ
nr:D-alanyl-D-alanine carboxypeptidase/D-alanyl-D-alanine-endopeptidase [uncultured Moraxella sp.]